MVHHFVYLFFIQMSYDNNGQNQVAIPSTEIPLNASDCTCSAINYIKDNHEAPGDNDPCIINDACNGLECFLNLGGMELSVEIEIVACGDSPGFIFILRDSEPNVLGEFFFTEDRNVTLAGTVPMDVKVEHGDYSMTISVRLYTMHYIWLLYLWKFTLVRVGRDKFRYKV